MGGERSILEDILYIAFSILDSLAALFLMFRIFRFPFMEYIKEVIVIATIISLESYFVRVIINCPDLDPIIQAWVYVITLRYICKFSWKRAQVVSLIGYLGFMAVQLSSFLILDLLGVVVYADTQLLWGLGTHLIQITTDILCFIIGWLIYRNGFSFMPRPPHDLRVNEKISSTNWLILVLGNVVLYVTLYWILNFQSILIIPIVILTYAILLFYYRKKDRMT
ncbi:hypothetical protein SAMN04487970_1005177 [Paenibacillus tianmuensis]|uniref:Uncharacterized protein n=1 Tax=Paenibacillus tianmuensis TaxID=624147 RepID=A0A1G4Q6A1_9BACL|nr:hypothetical protein SAMN04487970_1005177 [Paenibacillus tianmuensis]